MVTETKNETPTEQRRTVEHLLEQELAWYGRRRSAVERLNAAGREAGEDLISAGDPAAALSEKSFAAASLRAEIEACESAVVEARRQRMIAIADVWRCEAQELRRSAEPLIVDADKRQMTTDRLLARLREFEGVDYAPPDTRGPRPDPETIGGAPTVVMIPVPKTALIRHRAAEIEAQAQAMDARAAKIEQGRNKTVDGHARGSSLEQLLSAATRDPMVVAPSPIDIEEWAVAAEKAERHRRARRQTTDAAYVPVDAPMVFSIIWRKSVVDATVSYAGAEDAVTA